MTREIWTIGHSTRDLGSFLALLEQERIELVADVRRFPASRRHPHFGQAALSSALAERGIAYHHWPELGGRRNKRAEGSPNSAWRVEAFNAYADYMGSEEFAVALAGLQEEAHEQRSAIMCAEAVPWRCHRRLIADALVVRGWRVLDILAPGKVDEHHLTDFAHVDGDRITYPAEPLFKSEPAD
jgi:uncharacterized protein (DUF488 family)